MSGREGDGLEGGRNVFFRQKYILKQINQKEEKYQQNETIYFVKILNRKEISFELN